MLPAADSRVSCGGPATKIPRGLFAIGHDEDAGLVVPADISLVGVAAFPQFTDGVNLIWNRGESDGDERMRVIAKKFEHILHRNYIRNAAKP